MLKSLFDTWKKSDFQNQKIKMLWIFIVILCLIILLLWQGVNGIKNQLLHQRLYVTPAQVERGGYYKTNMIPNAIVYGFAYQMFVAINTWSTDAEKDYKKNIMMYRYYLTPGYTNELNQDYESGLTNGNIQDAIQTIAPYNGVGFIDTQAVKQISDNSWVVDLKLRVTHYKDNAVLLDALYDYKIKVVRTAESIQTNPWGLALAKLVSKTRIKTFI